MELEERVTLLETEFKVAQEELKLLLMDIRMVVMEGQSPFRPDPDTRGLFSRNGDFEKEVEADGDR
ncbi:MAG: hypothetical protein Q7R57_08380 [Dehalococcoidales bacterium]|nr:hypothetical protein [Dehalococcoidales bacterium]